MTGTKHIFLVAVFFATVVVPGYGAQEDTRPTARLAPQHLVWNKMVKLSDGRTFVTDGSFAIDAALARPATLPSVVLPAATAKVVEGYLSATLPDEFALAQLSAGQQGRYTAPSGVVLNAIYVDYLRRTLPTSRVRLRMKGDFEPAVVLVNGTPVGVVMPMKR